MINILDYSLEELKLSFKKEGIQTFRAAQIFSHLKNGNFILDEMLNIGKANIEAIKAKYEICIPEVVKILESKDGTKKALLRLSDNNIIESVLMKYSHGFSVCISTQIGCRMGCKFCASTKDGLVRNLSAGEMIAQILVLGKIAGDRISNVVLMGAGEPFDNFENVKKFLNLVNDEALLNIGQRHITISTSGIAPVIREFADLNNQVTLAISLHQTTDEKRKELMPVAYQYNLKELFEALRYYQNKTKRRITFEYALVKDVNDTKEDTIRLYNLLKGIKSHVNLIPLNAIENGLLQKPNLKSIEEFRKALEGFNIETTVRREMGSDIAAACGQLKRSYLSGDI